MHTLKQLRSGALQGITRLDLSANLTEFAPEIFSLADTLEVLNLSDNQLSSLPDDLPRLHKLKVLFCSNNPFTELPEVLGRCANLEMVGFKSCRIRHVSGAALPVKLRWLILTDNALTELPQALGHCTRLEKLMLSGNQLSALPESLKHCHNLALLRIAANCFSDLPSWLTQLPKLAWLAVAGNPLCRNEPLAAKAFNEDELTLGELLGQGASGMIYAATLKASGAPLAVKRFKGHMTSDGLPASELAACLRAGEHPNLVSTLGIYNAHTPTPDLVLKRLDARFKVLAGPPSLESCTRDCYAPNTQLTAQQAYQIALGVAQAMAHLHAKGLLHGDLYAHNLLLSPEQQVLLSDFGAASIIDDAPLLSALQKLESLAFGYLLDELLAHCTEPQHALAERLATLKTECTRPLPSTRPRFAQMLQSLAV